MAYKQGQNLRLFAKSGSGNYKCFAAAKSCQIHVQMNTETSTTKDTENLDEIDIVGGSWDLTTDGLYVTTDASAETQTSILALMLAKTKLQVKWDETSGSQNRTADSTSIARSGYAYIVDYTLNATDRQNVTYNIKLQGTGDLS